MEKRLGKISKAYFGHGGYQDACIGLVLALEGQGWGVATSKTAWDSEMVKHSGYCEWTEDGRSKQYADILRWVSKVLNDAKVSSVDRLVGIPVEAEFDGNLLKDWRVLTEVL